LLPNAQKKINLNPLRMERGGKVLEEMKQKEKGGEKSAPTTVMEYLPTVGYKRTTISKRGGGRSIASWPQRTTGATLNGVTC